MRSRTPDNKVDVFRSTARILFFAATVFISQGLLYAQTSATIQGTVKDPSEAVLPGATITATNTETGISRTTASGSKGEYRISSLPVGSYELKAELSGFQISVRKGLTLNVGQEAVMDFALQVGSVAEQVTVSAEAPLIETTTATVSGVVDAKQMRDIPLNARSFIELVPLQAGAVFAEAGSSSTSKGFGKKLSISGTRYNTNLFLLDGTDINDAEGSAGSAAETLAGVETVREFRAEFFNLFNRLQPAQFRCSEPERV